MRILAIFWLISFLFISNCVASAPVQLSGTGGQAILSQIASTNITHNVSKASTNDLWNWGMIPLGNVLSNGKLVSTGDEGSTVLFYPAFVTNTTPNFQISNPMAVNRYSLTDLQNPDLTGDYWTIAQLSNQPVLH